MTSEYGHPWLFFHRVDLHNGLKELAFGEEGEGPPVVLKLQSKVTSVVCFGVIDRESRHPRECTVGLLRRLLS